MADDFRDQVNAARRAGHSDEVIFNYLKDSDPDVKAAVAKGLSPAAILDYLAPKPTTGEEFVRKAGVAVRGVNEALAPVTAGAATGAAAGAMLGAPTGVGAGIGAIAGGLAVPAADVAVMGYNKLTDSNVRMPSQVISNWLPGPRAESPGERVLQASTGALGGSVGSVGGGQAIVNAARSALGIPSQVAQGTANIGREISRAPIGQIVMAPVSAGVGQATTESTGSPLAGLIAGVGTSALGGLRSTKREAVPTTEELLAKSKAAYEGVDTSYLQFFRKEFNTEMSKVPDKLRSDVGYIEGGALPKIDEVMRDLLANRPKDIKELMDIRKVIGGAAKSTDPHERLVASALLDEFDNYILNAPNRAFVVQDPKAINAWKQARADYSKVKKSEIITDILERADVSLTNKESAMAAGLSSLAKNEKKMRFFTPDEQASIKNAVRGDNLQIMLRTVGKLAPLTPAAAIFTAVNPYGAYTAAAGLTAAQLSKMRREQQVNQLAGQMRFGGTPEVIQGPLANEPMFVTQALRNSLAQQAQSQNALAP